jgi:hypothetical protein
MAKTPVTTEIQDWHRQTAMACNNRAWQLTLVTRSTEDDSEMLDAAHTAAYHWSKVGTALNRMRATMLLAEVHACLGYEASAQRYATEMYRFFLTQPETPDWELAFAHVIYAHCAFIGHQKDAHASAYQLAKDAIAAIADDEDRKIVNQTFSHVPAP